MSGELEKILEKIDGQLALAFSHQAEDAAALDLLLQCGQGIRGRLEVFTLDTRKLFPETVAYHKTIEEFFKITIKIYRPAEAEVEKLEKALGDEWGMRDSLENRRLCCDVRKVVPLGEALHGKNAWITGMRAAQAVTRAGLALLEWDEKNQLIKLNPLCRWTDEELDAYIKARGIPLHPLYGESFKSIGCSPCTRAVLEGEDIRAGRWWWEDPSQKECGLHRRPRPGAGQGAHL
ncbi:MAG: phosphoadenylyl-sulfate reductase [Spirochaetaceae bacterium]|jgi:phosphoadenosine phosphosulfate reductase|nr:phosphoadenylyl-sulfate reductase [Spirochaetaceae bacterium]